MGRSPRATITASADFSTRARPGWTELIVALVAAVVVYGVGLSLIVLFPASSPALNGVLQLGFSALAPISVFAIVVVVRLRDVRAFGVRRVDTKWLAVAVGLAVVCLVLIMTFDAVVATLYPGADDSQGQLRSAAQGGALALAGTVIFGGLLTPLGEELLFRGVIARFLQRWGMWVTVLISALFFATFHGINLVWPSAFVVGLCCGWLLYRTGSIWPGVLLHVIYNTTFLFTYS